VCVSVVSRACMYCVLTILGGALRGSAVLVGTEAPRSISGIYGIYEILWEDTSGRNRHRDRN